MEESLSVKVIGDGSKPGPDVEVASTGTLTESGSATGAAVAPPGPESGSGGGVGFGSHSRTYQRNRRLIGILKGLEIEKSHATDPVVVTLRYYPATTGSFAPLPPDLSPKRTEYLRGRELTQLHTHQRAAYDLAKAGKSFVVTRPTASGKTLCYNRPILDAIIKDTDTRALQPLFVRNGFATLNVVAQAPQIGRLAGR